MKIKQLLASIALGLGTAQASFKKPSADVYTALADLTRPEHLKQGNTSIPPPLPNYLQEYVSTGDGPGSDTRMLYMQHMIEKSMHDMESAERMVNSKAAQDIPSSFYPLNPPSIPLAVKGPYLNAWAPSGQLASATPPNRVGNGGYLAGQDPSFWTSSYGADGGYRMAWTGFIRVDNVTYQWLGNAFGKTVRAGENAKQLAMTYTATRSIFQFQAGSVLFNVTFMTPVWPRDYLRQSLPLSYMHFSLDSSTAANHSVQMYTDIDERWASAHEYDYENYPITQQWVDNNNGTSIYFVQRTSPQVLTEFRQRAEWGSAVYAARRRKGMASRNNNNVVAQFEFTNSGNLTYDHNPVGGPDNSFAYSIDFDGKGGNEGLFAIGHMRTPYVNYIKRTPGNDTTSPKSYLQDRYGYWMSKYPNFSDAVTFFMDDFENALSHCIKLDSQIDADSKAAVGGGLVGEMYSAITQLSVRQSFATIEITVPYNDTSRTYNTSDALIFLKEISSNGDMSTVDVFFPQFPLLTYFNPDLLRDIMKPIYQYTESGLYPNKWCVHDLGVYPSAFGHNDGKDEPMQVEESGNMILLTLHWAQLVGKKAARPFLRKHYKIMKQWAEFLITDSLIPAEQLSTDDFAGQLANQSNLAIKGIEGIAAMGHIADWLNKTKDAKAYRNVSSTYIQAFYGFAINKNNTHVKLDYQDDSSWGTLYNLIFDRLLNLELVAEEIYNKQDAFYLTKVEKYGTPLDSRFSWQKTDWAMFASATASTRSTRDYWIENLYKFVSDSKTDAPFSDLIETRTGDFPKPPFAPKINFIARPVVGGHLIHLALAKANKANKVEDYGYGPPIKKGKKKQKSVEASALSTIAANREQGERNIQPVVPGDEEGGDDEEEEQEEEEEESGDANQGAAAAAIGVEIGHGQSIKQEPFGIRGSRPALSLF